ncbi:MAG: multicopper oxidase domain-containing protein [Anaerolineae bacterium]
MATREYWLQIENHPWDVMPQGINRMTGEELAQGAGGLFRSLLAEALIIRRYTTDWAAPDDRPVNAWDLTEPDPAHTHGTIPGATIEAKVGDEIIVHLRNMDMRASLSEAERTHSLHPHGVQHSPLYDGAYPLSPPDPAQGGKRGDRVPPGDSFDYRWTCPFSSAGTWLYHDHSLSHGSVRLGALGALIVRGGGERKPDLPAGPLRQPGDGPLSFAAVPEPPRQGEYILLFHELEGAGECLNGRQLLGNTPTLLAKPEGRMRFRIINFTNRPQTFHVHGHRWKQGDVWLDTEILGTAGTLTVDMLEDSSQHGGGLGEWLVMSHASHAMAGTLLVTEGGAVTLPAGVAVDMPPMDDHDHHG